MEYKVKEILQELLDFCEENDCNVDVSTTRDFDTDKVLGIYLNVTTFDKNAMPNVKTFKIENI